MYFRTSTWTWARSMVNNMLSALTARPAAALLTTPTVVLFTGSGVPGPASVFADFTLANFSGYAAQALTPSAPVNLNVNVQALIGSATFIATPAGPFVANVIAGYILTDGVTGYYGGEKFLNPIPIAAPGDFLELDVALPEEVAVFAQ